MGTPPGFPSFRFLFRRGTRSSLATGIFGLVAAVPRRSCRRAARVFSFAFLAALQECGAVFTRVHFSGGPAEGPDGLRRGIEFRSRFRGVRPTPFECESTLGLPVRPFPARGLELSLAVK